MEGEGQSSSSKQGDSENSNFTITEGQEGIKFSNIEKQSSSLSFSISQILNIGGERKNKHNRKNNDFYNPNLAVSMDSVTLASRASKRRHKLIAEPEEPNYLSRSHNSIVPNHWNISTSDKSFFRGYFKEGETDSHQNNHIMSPPLVVHEVSQSDESTSSSPETKRLDSLTPLEDGLQINSWQSDDSALTRCQILFNPHHTEHIRARDSKENLRIANRETLQSPRTNPHYSNLDSPVPMNDIFYTDGNNEHEHANILETDIVYDNTDIMSPHQPLLSLLESKDSDNNFLQQLTMANLEKSKIFSKATGKNNQRSSNELSDMERGGESLGTTPFPKIPDDEEAEINDPNNEVDSTNDANQTLDEDAIVSPVSALMQLTFMKESESITDLDYGYFCDPRSEYHQDTEIIQKPANGHSHRWKYLMRGSILLVMLFAPLIYHKLVAHGQSQFRTSQFISPILQIFDTEKGLRTYSHQLSETVETSLLKGSAVGEGYSDKQSTASALHIEESISDDNPKPNTSHQACESNIIQPNGTPLLTIHNRINNKQQLFPGKALQIQHKLKEIRDMEKPRDSFPVSINKEKLVSSHSIGKMMKLLFCPVTIPVYYFSRCLFYMIQLLLSRLTRHHLQSDDELDLDFLVIL